MSKKHDNILTKQEKNCLTKSSFSTRNFYGLPKVHKSKQISEAIQNQNDEYIEIFEPSDLTVRPIVGGPNCPTRPLSELIDIILKPFLVHIKSYVRDNLDFLKKCSRENNDSTVLLTFDVKSLYTNIAHTYGLEAINFWIEKHQESLHPRFTKQFILDSIKVILENNNCTFNDEFYRQISGTAMGTIFAPTYATLTMGFLELDFYRICENKWGTDFYQFIIKNWSRYLDDCETPLDKSKVKPEDLLDTLNSINSSLQFTMEFSAEEIPFLDILIKRDNTGIWMDLYHKPTDTQRCLPFSTSHPKECLKNIPFVMARRICTIVENNNIKLKHLCELKQNFKSYGYPEKIVDNGIQRALKIPQDILRQPKTTVNKNNLTFISTFNPNNPKVYSLIKSSVKTLDNNNVDGFKNINLIHAKRQPPNLKRILTKSLFSNQETGVFKCQDSRCHCCQHLYLGLSYTFKTGKKFILKNKMTCDSRNLIYVVICSSCQEEYIGETGIGDTKLRDRVRIYRQHIRQPEYEKLKVEKHLRTCGKGNFAIFPFLQLRSNDTDLRREYEDYFIKKFKTKLNNL